MTNYRNETTMNNIIEEVMLVIVGVIILIIGTVLFLITPADPTVYKSYSKQQCEYIILSNGQQVGCDYINKGDTYNLVWIK